MAKDSDLGNYLDDLLMDDSVESTRDKPEQTAAPSTNRTTDTEQGDYKIYTFPSPQTQPGQVQQENTTPQNGERHKLERMERLLDDFNRRRATSETEQSSADVLDQHPGQANKTLTETNSEAYSDIVYKDGVLQPRWADDGFEVMIVEAGGLRIAIPVFSLGTIHSLKDSRLDTSKKPFDSALFVGTAEINHLHYSLIDSCRWLMPEQYHQVTRDDFAYRYYLTHKNSNYALAVNAVHTSHKLWSSQVRWRRADSKRPWMAGMLTNQRAILIELDVLMAHIIKTLN